MSLVSKPPAMVEAESLDMHPTWNEKQYIWDAASLTVSPAGEALSKGPNKRTPRGPLVCRIDKCRAPLADATAACQRNRVCKFHLEQPELDINGVLSRFCQQCGKFQHAYERFDGSNRSCRACLAARRAERRRKALAKQNLEADGSSGEQSSGEPFRTASGRQKRRAAQDAALEELDNADSGACPPPAGLENFANLAMALSLEAAAPADEPLANWANELQADGFEEELPLTTDLLPPGSPSFLTPYDFSSLSLPAAGSSPARMAGGDAPAQLQAPPQEGNAGAAAARWLHSGSEESPMEEDNPMVFVPVMRPANPVPAAAPPPLPAQVQSEALPAPTLTMHDMQSALTSTIVHQPGVAKRGDGDRAGMQPPFPMPGTGYFGGHTAGRSRLASCSTDVPQEPLCYRSEEVLLRLSLKMAHCRPEDLPHDLYMRLASMLQLLEGLLLHGFLRPGCTHLLLQLMLPVDADLQAVAPGLLLEALASQARLPPADVKACLGEAMKQMTDMVMQQGGSLTAWRRGDCASAGQRVALPPAANGPTLAHASAVAMLQDGGATLRVWGSGLDAPGCKLFVRCNGAYLPFVASRCSSSASGQGAASGAAPLLRDCCCQLELKLSGLEGPGLLFVEAEQGDVLTAWKPVLLLDDVLLAADVRRLEALVLEGKADARTLHDFVIDLGHVVDIASWPWLREEPPAHWAGGSAAPAARAPRGGGGGRRLSSFSADDTAFEGSTASGATPDWSMEGGIPVLPRSPEAIRAVTNVTVREGLDTYHSLAVHKGRRLLQWTSRHGMAGARAWLLRTLLAEGLEPESLQPYLSVPQAAAAAAPSPAPALAPAARPTTSDDTQASAVAVSSSQAAGSAALAQQQPSNAHSHGPQHATQAPIAAAAEAPAAAAASPAAAPVAIGSTKVRPCSDGDDIRLLALVTICIWVVAHSINANVMSAALGDSTGTAGTPSWYRHAATAALGFLLLAFTTLCSRSTLGSYHLSQRLLAAMQVAVGAGLLWGLTTESGTGAVLQPLSVLPRAVLRVRLAALLLQLRMQHQLAMLPVLTAPLGFTTWCWVTLVMLTMLRRRATPLAKGQEDSEVDNSKAAAAAAFSAMKAA